MKTLGILENVQLKINENKKLPLRQIWMFDVQAHPQCFPLIKKFHEWKIFLFAVNSNVWWWLICSVIEGGDVYIIAVACPSARFIFLVNKAIVKTDDVWITMQLIMKLKLFSISKQSSRHFLRLEEEELSRFTLSMLCVNINTNYEQYSNCV